MQRREEWYGGDVWGRRGKKVDMRVAESFKIFSLKGVSICFLTADVPNTLQMSNPVTLFPSSPLVSPLPQLGDTGMYTCIASTPSGEASWKAYLEVQGKLLGLI